MMDDFNSETDSDYTSYWRDWVSQTRFHFCESGGFICLFDRAMDCSLKGVQHGLVRLLPGLDRWSRDWTEPADQEMDFDLSPWSGGFRPPSHESVTLEDPKVSVPCCSAKSQRLDANTKHLLNNFGNRCGMFMACRIVL